VSPAATRVSAWASASPNGHSPRNKIGRRVGRPDVTLIGVDEGPELYVSDFSDSPGAAERREARERARAEGRRRYRDHLGAAFDMHGVQEPAALVEVALDALTRWQYVESGEPCACSCHPRLPESDLHDYGFDCTCTRTPADRRRAWDRWRADIEAFQRTPEGQRFAAEEHAAETELQAWLVEQPEVTVHSWGGWVPEQWWGEVDGHRFYFRERHDQWRVELDPRPSGRIANVVVDIGGDGDIRAEQRQVEEGDVIAHGTIAVEGYGATLVERARFIVDTIRIHLRRQACTLHAEDWSSIETLLGRQVGWCPACGIRLSTL
jgi:hypothetical protein